MAQSVTQMMIMINGQVGANASKVSDYLTRIGSMLDQIGSKTRQMQKESLEIYRGYEDEMLAAKYALSASVDSASQLEQQMDGLDKAAQKWAASSIFHTDDVSRAINNAAHAGWDYQEILEGIPQAMLIAQAGGLDLSEGLDYLIKMMNSTRTPMSEMGTMVDQWAMAANSSATNIGEMGEAFRAMGATAGFAENNAEIFSMLAALANVGSVGSQAGTALRSTMMRLVAPTTKAEDAMSLLGADADELSEVLSDENVTKAAKKLEGLGFSAYTSSGKMKPMRQIFSELFELTENLDEASKNEIMGAIFPSRTIATALSLLNASNGELDELYEKIAGADGYASKGADIMMSGLTGSIETLKSKWEEFERKIGETMSPTVESVANSLSGFLDGLNNLPPEVMSGITSMLSALSATGPLLIGAGVIGKMVSSLGVWGTAAVGAGLAMSFLIGYVQKLEDIDFHEHFGTLEMDLETMNQYVDSLSTKFSEEQKAITTWQSAVEEAQKKYEDTVGTMNEGLLKKVLTGGTFTQEDFDQFTQLGKDIVKYTQDGIENAETRDLTLLSALFGDSPDEADTLENLSALTDYNYSTLYGEAYQIGENIKNQLTAALQNGELTAEDREAIQAQVDRMHKINAEISAARSEDEYYTQLARAGRVSWDSAEAFLKSNVEKLAAENTAIDDEYSSLIGRIRGSFNRARKNGNKTATYTDINGETVTVDVSEEAEEKAIRELNRERDEAHRSADSKYGSVSMEALDTLFRDNEYALAWEAMKRAAAGESIESQMAGMDVKDAEALNRSLGEMLKLYTSGRFGFLEQFATGPAGAEIWNAVQQLNDANIITQRASAALDQLKLAISGGAGAGEFNWTVDDEEVQDYEPPVKHGTVVYDVAGEDLEGYATGGRATEASIFGEAGAEWAIPEEHSARTAALLDAARRASGFTWGELLSRYGGLNANANNTPVVLNYSPVINAGDANGVAGALAADKDRLLRMVRQAMNEARYRESVEVFA